MVKLRLSRQGRKKLPIYKIVVADSRSRRDGRFIESLGQYRPENEPGQKVQVKEDRVMHWLKVGAQPTDTVRSLLSGEGILLKWHLEKKQIEPARASEIFTIWKATKDAKLSAQQDAKLNAKEEAKRKAAAKKAAVVETAAPEATAPEAAPAEAPVEPAAVAEESAAPVEASAPAEAPLGDAASAATGDRPAESVEG